MKEIRKKGDEKRYLLLTATIDPSVYNNVGNILTNVEERLNQYRAALKNYITESAFTDIVFAENSGYLFDKDRYWRMAEEYGKRFEYLSCPIYSKETEQFGKSYGESRLINDALAKSNLLLETDYFYKVTGRVYLKNSRNIVKSMKKHKNEFLVVDKHKWCYTHVFKVDKNDYQRFFSGAYERIMLNRVNLEHNYYSIIKENHDYLDIGCFDVWPYVLGRQGSTGASYTNSFKGRIYHDLLCKCKAYTYNSPLGGILTL